MNIWVFISVIAVALAIYSMIDVLRVRIAVNKKMIWFALVVIVPILGPLVYMFRKELTLSDE